MRGGARMAGAGGAGGHVGHWQLTVPDNRLIWSDEIYRIHGLWREHYQPRIETALAAFHPLDGKRVAGLLQDAAAQRRQIRGGGAAAPAGWRDPACDSARPAPQRVRQVEAVNGVMVDVTEPKRAESQIAVRMPARRGTAGEDPLTGLVDRRAVR